MKLSETWNRCDKCGRFIALEDFGNGAVRRFVTYKQDTYGNYSRDEVYETLCKKHAPAGREALKEKS